MRKYHNRAIETTQLMEVLIQMMKDFKESIEQEEDLGLNKDKVAFYHVLAENESAVRELGDEILKRLR